MPIIETSIGPDGQLVTTTADPTPEPPADVPTPAPDPAPTPAALAPEAPAPPDSAPDGPQTPETSEDDDEEAPEPVPRGVQRRIDRLTRQREDARRESAAIKARLDMLEQGYRKPPAEAEPIPLHQQPEPREEDYPSQQEWYKAVREWDKAQLKQELAREQQEARQRDRQTQQQQRLVAQAQAARQKHADFDTVLDRLSGVYTAPALDACVQESELGAELAYYLAQHPDEMQRLNQVAHEAPLAMAREIGKLELRLSAPAPAPAGNGTAPSSSRPSPPLPPPVQPLAGTGSAGPAEPDFDTMSQREFEAWWKRSFPGVR